VVQALTADGLRRVAWALAGPGAIVAGAAVWIWRTPLRARLDSARYGDLVWIGIETILVCSIVATWVAAIGSSRRVRPVRLNRRLSWLASPAAATIGGLLVPGLGLMMAGKRKLASAAFSTMAPMIAAALVLGQWRWVAQRASSPMAGVLTGPMGEVVLVGALLVLALSVFAWIVQALDGARRVSWGREGRPAIVSLALVLALGVFATTFRTHAFARNLEHEASALHAEGLRLIPWGLCEAAAHLDPMTPRYQVHAAKLATELGLDTVAAARWERLERTSEEWIAAREALPGAAQRGATVVAGAPGPL
jgi:hypothetical protein